jgi:probable HAF family extracellular repeat protein
VANPLFDERGAMHRRSVWAAFFIAASVFTLTPTPRAQISASFEPLGLGPAGIPSVFSRANDASADGSVVIGEYFEQSGSFFILRGFRWTAATGMQDLGALNPNAPETEALAVSADGSQIVGWSRGMSGSQRPFLWTATGGMQELVEVPGSDAVATGISNDGRTIAGHFLDGTYQAFRWRDGLVTPLGFLPGEPNSFGRAVCGAGDAVVGSTHSAGGYAFRWTEASGMQQLPSLRPDALAYPQACSDDGTVVVGSGSDGEGKGQPPIRWDPTGVRSLGTLGGDSGEAHAVSADGTVVAGAAGLPFVNGISEFAAFRWTTATRKIEQLSRVLESRGVTTPFCHDPWTCPAGTWFVRFALGISADGKVIVGEVVNPDNRQEAYRAIVP